MTDASPLIVPLAVEGFVVNDWVREGGPFVRAQMQYGALRLCGNAQPGLNDRDLHFGESEPVPPHRIPASDYYNGVYLKWRLPRAFTHGVQDSAAGKMHFRPIPNRWIVVRYGGPLNARSATAWIVESDYIWPSGQAQPAMNASQVSSLYVQERPRQPPLAVYMGRNVALGSWTEPGTSQTLTAVAPGNTAFAFYQPNCNNVLSFIDVLAGAPSPQTLSYQVFGWFSCAEEDPLAAVATEGFASVMAELGWTLPVETDPSLTAGWSVLCGYLPGVQWQTAGRPPGGVPSGASVSIAAANTAVQALTALVTAQASAAGAEVDAELLEAFQLDMLDVLDEPDGAAKLAEKLFASFFQRFSGGYEWEIVNAPGAEPVSPQELEKELEWLAALNVAQAALDADIRTLSALQLQLYEMWWKYANWPEAYQGHTVIKGPTGAPLTRADLLNELQPSVAGTIAQRVAAQLQRVLKAAEALPTGATPAELEAAIADYAREHELPSSRVLKRTAAPRFCAPNNPAVLIAGAGASGIVAEPEQTVCRFPSQLLHGFRWQGEDITAATPGLTLPRPDLTYVAGVPWSSALASALVEEAFFSDLNSATAICEAIPNSTVSAIRQAMIDAPIGTAPAGAVQAWRENPWHPLLLLWQASYHPIAYGTTATPNWSYDEGRYLWDGAGAGQSTAVGGVIQLSPAAALNLAARLKAFLASHPRLDSRTLAELERLLRFVESQDNDWDVLSQTLDGFNEQLRLGMPGTFMGPESSAVSTEPPLDCLIGEQDAYPPGIGGVPKYEIPPSDFLPWRAGQFSFTELIVIDEWGQAVWPIDDANARTELVYLPAEMTPILVSNSLTFAIADGAHVDEVEPTVIAAGTRETVLTVTGSGFPADATVEWNAAPLPTVFVSASRLTATVSAALSAHATTVEVVVRSGEGMSNATKVTVTAGPGIESLSPDLLQAGMASSAEVPVEVHGAGFRADAVVHWDGLPLLTTWTDPTALIAAVPATLLAAPANVAVTVVAGSGVSPPARFTIAPGAAIASITPASVQAGSEPITLVVDGVGFDRGAYLAWNGEPLASTYLSSTRLSASVPATLLARAGSAAVTESFGHAVIPAASETFVQLAPRLLQPARLDFPLLSATNDEVVFGPAAPSANPICGWVLPNHLDASLMAYDSAGSALGELSLGVTASGSHPCWTPAPGSLYATLAELAAAIAHFGPFLQALGAQDSATFSAFLAAVDETLWSTVPMDAAFDRSLAVLIGRPLAMVRACVRFELNGPPYPDPSWQYTFEAQPNVVTGYQFAIELGNIARLDDGLIGYFEEDVYETFNVVQQSGASSSTYLRVIGADDNYLYLPFAAGSETHLSMLVDPRAAVHATTAILPDARVALPPQFVDQALRAMDVAFRLNGVLTDETIATAQPGGAEQPTVRMPLPDEKAGTWSWVEKDREGWARYPVTANDASAQLSDVTPTLRRGLLQLAAALNREVTTDQQKEPP